ncbi:hypothetical protein MRB56_11410 [Halomonas cupida]|uniref:Imm33-like domain-containing protein n=1 Tax=Halomonas cupida TaxID=44933 RepID=A0A1M7N2D7_9GAMM|nr:hypothetical protein [Halomonas cupida]SHM97695.1 hypothetical protein SAMN05660971_04437 [Halomonas cupida]
MLSLMFGYVRLTDMPLFQRHHMKGVERVNLQDEQQEVCKRTGSEVIFPSLGDIAGVAIHTAKESPIYGVREDPENGSSGWYIWAGEYSDAADFFKPLGRKV